MKKKCKVVMLSINKPIDKGQIFMSPQYNHLSTAEVSEDELSNPEVLIPQHLYLVSDDKIQEGDYVIEEIGGVVFGPIEEGDIIQNAKKIIATTDKSLTDLYDEPKEAYTGIPPRKSTVSFPKKNRLPQIPQSFVKQYVEANGKIDEVLVKYKPDYPLAVGERCIPKLQNNEVIIYQDRTYTREEVESKLVALHEHICTVESHYIIGELELNVWIEKNLD